MLHVLHALGTIAIFLVVAWFVIGVPIAIFNMLMGGHRDRQRVRAAREYMERGTRQIIDTPPAAPPQQVEKVRRLDRRRARRRG